MIGIGRMDRLEIVGMGNVGRSVLDVQMDVVLTGNLVWTAAFQIPEAVASETNFWTEWNKNSNI